MFSRSGRLLMIFFGATCLAACGGSGESRPTEAPVSQPVNGSVVEALDQVAQGRFVDDCFRGTEDRLREMARALDQRKQEIQELSLELAKKDRSHRLIQLGPIVVREPRVPDVPASQWKRVDYDWASTYQFFKKIEARPVDSDWIYLNGKVRSMLSSESTRLVDGWDYADGRESKPYLQSVFDRVDACYRDQNCLIPDLTASDRAYILRPGYFTNAFQELQKTSIRTERRKWIELLRKIVLGRLQTHSGFRVNPEMRQVSPGRFEINVDAGDLEIAKWRLGTIVEAFWQDTTHQIRIQWQPKRDGLYRLFADLGTGGRAFVHHTEKAMHLYSGIRTPVLAHEFGHIFGFVDYYYEVWDARECRYTVEWDEGDLMSNSNAGAVLPSHWEMLKSAYPL